MRTPRAIAIQYLARREHSRAELQKKLQAKQIAPEEIDAVLDRLKKDNLQSDNRFTDAYVRYRKQAGFGPNRIAQELKARGVSQALIANHLKNHNDWYDNMIVVCQKYFSETKKSQEAQYRFLLQRGYDADMIYRWMTNAQ